jgi:hypothetical protein
MVTKWWRFIPRLGWDCCTEQEAKALLERIERDPVRGEGYQVLEVEEHIDPAVIAAMRQPVMILHPTTHEAMKAAGDLLPRMLEAFPHMTVRTNDLVPTDKVYVMEGAPSYKTVLFTEGL